VSKRPQTGTGLSRVRMPGRRLRDLPIWSKLGLIMIVPTIATIIVGTAGLVDNIAQANAADRARTLAGLSSAAGRLAHELQDERAQSAMILAPGSSSKPAIRTAFDQQTQTTNEARKDYALRRSSLADLPESFRLQLGRIDSQLSVLDQLREQIKTGSELSLSLAAFRYRVLIADLLSIRDTSSEIAGSEDLGADMRTAAAVSNSKEFLSQERVVVLRILAQGAMTAELRREFVATLTGQEQARQTFDVVATPEQRIFYDQTVTGTDLREAVRYQGLVESFSGDKLPSDFFTAEQWDTAMVGKANLLRKVETDLDNHVIKQATRERDALQRTVLVETGLLLGMLLLAILFAWVVARSMARSLRELRHGALTVAQYGLPQAVARLRDPALSTQLSPQQVALQIAEPLPVRSHDEFGQVAEAFNAVHLEAVRTAAEQAALRASVATMFVNLARRSQILVDRLIGHLDRLERGEEDPDRLAELFQLDHLATRMRRNDENLLVLAGADSSRIQRDAAPLMDVLRAAQSEVEHYTRIEFGMIDRDVEIAAHAVNDMVHLVAELLDNATAFSPPDSPVVVEARRVGDRGVLLIEDRGIGVSPEQLQELNERLAEPPMVDVAVSRMMGLVVVARLAVRHGVKVELRPARDRGTIADVTLPPGVLVPRALAGRSQTGVPPVAGARGPIPAIGAGAGAGPRPGYTPLALESGLSRDSAGGFGHGPGARPIPALGGVNGPSAGLGTPLAPNGPLGGGPAGTGFGSGPPVGGGPGGHSRGLPAWSDLTGANGSEMRPPSAPPSRPGSPEPLPQRRSGDHWTLGNDRTPDDDRGDGESPLIPRQRPAGARDPADQTGDTGPESPPPTAAAPAPAAPPAWPPVAPGADGPAGDAAAPPVPEAFSAALDMTAEIPRVRWDEDIESPYEDAYRGGPGQGGPNGGSDSQERFADETMELPIFRELESAWFRTRQASSPGDLLSPVSSNGTPGSADPSVVDPDRGRMVAGSSDDDEYATVGSAARFDSDAGSSAVEYEPIWQTAADEGWRAASALSRDREFSTTDTGLPKRVPMSQLVPGGVERNTVSVNKRTPEAVRGLLSAYHRGVQRGRSQPKADDSMTAEPTTTGPQNSQAGKEQES
jgi:signal transduction histidine kinase